jgi:hypothetical protein
MTEAEWLDSSDPRPMVEFLQGGATIRKLQLFASACCRAVEHLWTDNLGLWVVEVAEQDADGMATTEEVKRAMNRAIESYDCASDHVGYDSIPDDEREFAIDVVEALWAVMTTVCQGGVEAARTVAAFDAINPDNPRTEERRQFSILLREMFGPILFRPTAIDWSSIAWNNQVVAKLAIAIYNDRAFDRLPILADALEDAGCDNVDILAHCRGPGPHVRGCWVVDLILGKQ